MPEHHAHVIEIWVSDLLIGEEVLRAVFRARGLLCRDADRYDAITLDLPYHVDFGKFVTLPRLKRAGRNHRYYVLVSEYVDDVVEPRSKLFVCERYIDIAEIESFFLTIGVEGWVGSDTIE